MVIGMLQDWSRWLYDRTPISEYYSVIPELEHVAVSSIAFDRWGASLAFRIAWDELPDRPLEQWQTAGCDRFEFQLRFIDAQDLHIQCRGLPGRGRISLSPAPRKRLVVRLSGENSGVGFSCSDQLHVGRVNAYKASDPGTRYHAGLIARRLAGVTLPAPTARWYYEKF
jgi:hypothetical protein